MKWSSCHLLGEPQTRVSLRCQVEAIVDSTWSHRILKTEVPEPKRRIS